MDTTTATLMEYEINKLSKKVLKMENTIKKLTNENASLKSKVNSLESILSSVCKKIDIKMPQLSSSNIDSLTSHSKNIDTVEETWLYYIPTKLKISKEQIQKTLKITDEDFTYIDIKANWKSESEMFLSLLNSFQTFSEFNKDFQDLPLSQLIECFEEIFEVSIMGDTVVVLRGIPSSKNKKNYEKIVDSIGTLAGVMSKDFNKQMNLGENVGRMALILEAEEEMNIINIVKNDSRVLLSVEKLNC